MSQESFNFKFKEDSFIKELYQYVKTTYNEHYTEDDNIQFMDLIMADRQFGIGFLKHNASKYILRYGKKEGFNKKDLLKSLHYILLLLYKVEKDTNKEKENKNETITTNIDNS